MFKIITPVYNSEQWIGKCISSVKSQIHQDFLQVIIDDCSTDNTVNVIIEAIGEDSRFILIQRMKRTGIMHGHILGVNHGYREDQIIVHLDGDDWFSSDEVLSRLDKIYEDDNIFATYGSYETTDGTPCVCRDLTKEERNSSNSIVRSFLLKGWIFSQVRSFRAFLWESLTEEDFRSISGKYFLIADVAVFIPILELAGFSRVKYVPEVQMVYNRDNPLNHDKTDPQEAIQNAFELSQREPKQLWLD